MKDNKIPSGIIAEVKQLCPDASHFAISADSRLTYGIYDSDAAAAASLAMVPGLVRMFKLDFLGTPHEIYCSDY